MSGFFKAGKYSLKIGEKTFIMGILNVTPDSFSDGGKYMSLEKAVQRAFEIENLGADIIDIGGQSTRPGFKLVSPEEEWSRLSELLCQIKDKLHIPISIDTFYPKVAKKAIQFGASIINDVTGFENPEMLEVISESEAGAVLMHCSRDGDIKQFFENKIKVAEEYGISRERICLDPGIGFNKTRPQDRWIINYLKCLKIENMPMLVGVSRKRVIAEFCDYGDNCARLPGTVAANTLAISQGADIIRVHDVKESVYASRLVDSILQANTYLIERNSNESDNNKKP